MVNDKVRIRDRIKYVMTGEMSNMRKSNVGFFGRISGAITGRYQLDTSKVDYDISRALYDNTLDDYKLGSGFTRVIINNRASFMGVPKFVSKDKVAQEILDDFCKENVTNAMRIILDFLRDGDLLS